MTLSAAGYRPFATAVEELEAALAEARWELVVVGGSHEGVDGPAVCELVRSHPRYLGVPVIVEASIAHGDRPAEALAAGADDYVIAPWEPIELRTRVRLALTADRVAGDASRWHALVANLPGTVYRCDLSSDWRMHYMSAQVEELTGYTAEVLVGNADLPFSSLIHPDDRDAVEAEVRAAVARSEPFVCRYRLVGADGDVRSVVDRGRLVEGRHGRRWLDGFIVDVTAWEEAQARLRDTLAERATAEERARIARDLHDSVSQSLFSMTLHARAAQLALQRKGGEEGPEHRSVAELRDLAQAALAEMRALIFELRPEALADEGLIAALRKHAAAIAAREALPVEVSTEGALALDGAVEEALYRFAQEALNNVVKHARATSVTIMVRAAGAEGRPAAASDRVVVEVRDDGVGFDPAAEHPGHVGLITMHERLARIGGTLKITSAPGAGTFLRVEAPAAGAR